MRVLLYYPAMALIELWRGILIVFAWLLERPLAYLARRIAARHGIHFVEDGQNRTEKSKRKLEENSCEIIIHNREAYRRGMVDGSLGMGEAYIDGLWDCDRLVELGIAASNSKLIRLWFRFPWNRLIHYLKFEFFNLQTSRRAYQIGKKHYDLGNELFESFLDKNMNYSCGYWRNAKDLEEAQLHKMDLIARKLHLKPGMRVLDIGCGWGNLCKYLAEKYQVSVVGATISVEQAKLAQERCQGLPVEIRVTDYRKLDEKFDRIVSVGMFEHVGELNYHKFFKVAHRCLADDGIFLLHTIGNDDPYLPASEAWMSTYIFPNSRVPYVTEIPQCIKDLFILEDWHNFGSDYAKTTIAWHANFVKNWPTIKHLFKQPEKFYRMWTFYLLVCAGAFRARQYQLWQIVLSKNGVAGGYNSVR